MDALAEYSNKKKPKKENLIYKAVKIYSMCFKTDITQHLTVFTQSIWSLHFLPPTTWHAPQVRDIPAQGFRAVPAMLIWQL